MDKTMVIFWAISGAGLLYVFAEYVNAWWEWW